MQQVIAVEEGSLAARHGIVPGDLILSINGEKLLDDIDYQALAAARRVRLDILREDGSNRRVTIVKEVAAPLGLQFAESILCDPRTCGNQCVFCFVDQMPKGMRQSLYVKDDDWRLSLMMGNFVTLTNVGDREFQRLIRRRASPLYVSVHATDPAIRAAMMGQPLAAKLMSRLHALRDAGLRFHSQVVLCPGLNDGDVLENTLKDLYALRPHALSVALVPVGLTKFRQGLTDLRPFTKADALDALRICARWQEKAYAEYGERFVYPADELICLAEAPLPPEDSYDGYPQIENGIGMIRLFEEELAQALREEDQPAGELAPVHVTVACGTSIAPYMRDWVKRCAVGPVKADVRPITNDFFGHTVTVSGLVTGQDLARQLFGQNTDLVLLPASMLNSEQTLFLDDMTVADVEAILQVPVRVIPCQGDQLAAALRAPRALLAGTFHEGGTHDSP